MRNRDKIHSSAQGVAELYGAPGFVELALVQALKESAGNPRAISGGMSEYRTNAARGLYGMRPETAAARDRFISRWMLMGPVWLQTAVLARAVNRAVQYRGAEGWDDVIAWFAYPSYAAPGIQGEREVVARAKARRFAQKLGLTWPAASTLGEFAEWKGWPATLAAAA